MLLIRACFPIQRYHRSPPGQNVFSLLLYDRTVGQSPVPNRRLAYSAIISQQGKHALLRKGSTPIAVHARLRSMHKPSTPSHTLL